MDADAEDTAPWTIAVGASAGGLEALQRFFKNIPAGTNAAFVVIQHLAPDHRSLMPELLARYTQLKVAQATDGDRLLADRIYLIPPGVTMTVQSGRLVMAPRPAHGLSLPIDVFLNSLVAAQPRHSIAVILSGSGSDGAAGAAALQAAGGYVMAQSPDSARFDSMPRSVAQTALLDVTGPPEELIHQALQLAGGHPSPVANGEAAGLLAFKPALQRLFERLREASGIDFTHYKLPTVMRRIERRMLLLACETVADYADMVEGSDEECEALRRELLIPVTSMFRDPQAFQALQRAVQDMLLTLPDDQPLRIWCAGCATGEEAFSLAITAMEACQAVDRWPPVKVFATDVDPRFLAVGGAGSYLSSAADAIPAGLVSRYFTLEDERMIVRPEVRRMVLFARHNLLEDAPFTRMNLVSCRNALIYFQPEAQERVMRRLQYALNPRALLLLGPSESLGPLQPDFDVLDSKHNLYRINRAVMTSLAVRDGFNRHEGSARHASLRRSNGLARGGTLVDKAAAHLLEQFAPVSLLVTAQRQLLHTWGPTGTLLRLRRGQPNLDFISLLPERLGAAAGYALHCALREGSDHTQAPVDFDIDGQTVRLRISARLLKSDDGGQEGVLIVLDPVDERLRLRDVDGLGDRVQALPPRVVSETEHVLSLERELAETRITLHTSIESLESTNEELQSTNEELMSSNEELQSTNEELQSVNEELHTVNAEYNQKLDMVTALNADLDGMSRSTGIATVFVDEQMRLLRFTPEAMYLFRLRPDDIGRPITDFNAVVNYPGLANDLQAVIANGSSLERDLAGEGDAQFLARIVGYRDGGQRDRRRAVLSLIDVTRLQNAERLQRLIDSLPEHIALIDHYGELRQVNRAWSAFARVNGGLERATGVGSNYLAAIAKDPSPAAVELLAGLRAILDGSRQELRYTYPCHGPDRERWFVLHAAPLQAHDGSRPELGGAVIAHIEVTAGRVPGLAPQNVPLLESAHG